MPLYAIVETEAGLTVAEVEPAAWPEEAAVKGSAVVVDPGPYKTYEDAYDAMLALPDEDAEPDWQ